MSEVSVYVLKRSLRVRRLRITVGLDGRVCVVAPNFISEQAVQKFVQEKWPWVLKARQKIAARPAWDRRLYTKKDYRENKEAARELILSRLNFFAKRYLEIGYRLSWNTISIRDQKSRWGSCSRKRNLNFNYKLVFLPTDLQDYIIVHELCHLGELNHSKRFWSLVALLIPEYNERRKWLTGRIK